MTLRPVNHHRHAVRDRGIPCRESGEERSLDSLEKAGGALTMEALMGGARSALPDRRPGTGHLARSPAAHFGDVCRSGAAHIERGAAGLR